MSKTETTEHTPGPWTISILGGESNPVPEGLTDAQRQRWDKIMADQRRPFRHNDGSFNIIAGQGDERFPVATAVLRVHKKRSQAHTIEDPEAEANARLIAASPDLLAMCKELRDAAAACFRVIAKCGGVTDLERELERSKIYEGFGARADILISEAEGRA